MWSYAEHTRYLLMRKPVKNSEPKDFAVTFRQFADHLIQFFPGQFTFFIYNRVGVIGNLGIRNSE